MTEDNAYYSQLAERLVGLRVSHAWLGHGSTVFLELGELTQSQTGRNPAGEACLQMDWDWRFESEERILCGSSSSKPQVHRTLEKLVDSTIERLVVSREIAELTAYFSNGMRLRSMAMIEGDPRWSAKLDENSWMYFESGKVMIGLGEQTCSEAEHLAFDETQRAAARWGKPTAEPKLGDCQSCRNFVPIDGSGYLLDYGCCTSDSSSLDGHVVHVLSGCPDFNQERH